MTLGTPVRPEWGSLRVWGTLKGSYLEGPRTMDPGYGVPDIPWMAQRAVAVHIQGTGDPVDG